MTESELVRSYLESTFDGEAWHGPSLMAVLDGIPASVAAERLSDSAHTIWELVLHIRGWMQVGLLRLDGVKQGDPPDGDFPEVPAANEQAWQETIAALGRTKTELAEKISGLSAEQLDTAVAGSKTTARELLHGVIWHNVYHAGQIAILRRALRGRPDGWPL
jgi:uncharacterized damage-inducible protein DinB